jgi:hypothetical protein
MDLDTRALASFIGKTITDVRGILDRTHADRFEVGRGAPVAGEWPHVLFLTEPLDDTSASLVVEEIDKAFGHDPRRRHNAEQKVGDGPQVVYMAWSGQEYPGRRPLAAGARGA